MEPEESDFLLLKPVGQKMTWNHFRGHSRLFGNDAFLYEDEECWNEIDGGKEEGAKKYPLPVVRW